MHVNRKYIPPLQDRATSHLNWGQKEWLLMHFLEIFKKNRRPQWFKLSKASIVKEWQTSFVAMLSL